MPDERTLNVRLAPWVWLSTMREVIETPASKGYSHSLSYAASRFAQVLSDLCIGHGVVEDPAAYTLAAAERARRAACHEVDGVTVASLEGDTGPSIHMCIREWSDMRLMPAAEINVSHFSWEGTDFPQAMPSIFGAGPLDTVAVFDKVLTCSRALEGTLKERGIAQAAFVPTPIVSREQALGCQTQLQYEALIREVSRNNSVFCPYLFRHDPTFPFEDWELKHLRLDADALGRLVRLLKRKTEDPIGGPKIFITQGNPGDQRKNLVATMEGFGLWAADVDEAYLLVLTPPLDHRATTEAMAAAALERFGWGWWGSRNVFILPIHLTRDSQLALYGLGDFFLNVSRSEGQHVPLQEAIQAGCLPVSSHHTAMLEYLDPSHAIVIPTQPRQVTLFERVGGPSFVQEWWEADPLDIAAACDDAAALGSQSLDERLSHLRRPLAEYTSSAVGQRLEKVVLEDLQ